MTMPRAFPRAHFQPSWKGDRLAAINVVSRMKHKGIDMNFQWGEEVAWCMHWTTPARNNYTYLMVRGAKKARRMSVGERNRPISKWTDDQISKWRRTSNPKSARPRTYATCARYAAERKVVICAELKSQAFATPKAAQYMVSSAKAVGHRPWFMALYKMKNVRGKAKAISEAGGEFAVIFGNFPHKRPPADWNHWDQWVSQVWGANWKGK